MDARCSNGRNQMTVETKSLSVNGRRKNWTRYFTIEVIEVVLASIRTHHLRHAARLPAVFITLVWSGCSSQPGENAASGASNETAGMPAAGESGASTGGASSAGSAARAGTNGDGAHAGSGGSSSSSGAGGAGVAGGGAGGGGAVGGSTGGTSSAGGAGLGGAGNEACPGAVYDPASPPKTLTLSGNLGAHDPAAYVVGKTVYLAATGITTKSSTNLTNWTSWPAGGGARGGAWAPDLSSFGGVFHLYYAVSTFGSNKSCIGHATRAALDSGSFTDHGSVLCSNANGSSDDFNAIDPNVVQDQDGTPWLAFGSFWGGIELAALKMDGTRDGTSLTSLAARPSNGGALEGPFIVRRCGYYYLFVSFGACCGSPWDYEVRVGRAADVKGPYVDKDGVAMKQGGGTLVVKGNATWTAPGHNAVIFTGTRAYNVYHALDANHANATLRVAELAWDSAGWPISGGP